MDQKTWLWRKKSSEKTILANSEEAQIVTNEKEVELENSLKALNEKLASVLDECLAKDEVIQNYKKTAEDALAEKEKAEEKLRHLKEELDEVHEQKMASNERLGHLNSALKDCMDQLNLVRHEQDQRVHDAVMETSKEFEKSHRKLEEKLTETGKRVASLTSENSYLSKALLVKERLVDDLNNLKAQTEAEFEALMARLDSVEKENAFLRYEFMSLEKELQLRNDEMEYNRRSSEASHKQYLENVKKIKKLEAECQRLRALTRNQGNARRKAVSGGSIVKDSSVVHSPENTNKHLSFLIDQVQDFQRENKFFKECLAKKEEEIFHLRKIKNFELTTSNPASDEVSFTSGYAVNNSNEVSSSQSRAIALVTDKKTEPECKMIGSEMRLMDDFVEMEKLAIVAVKNPDEWLQVAKNAILDQHDVSRRSINELLEDVILSLQNFTQPKASKLLPISGYITWKSPASSTNSSSVQESSTDILQFDLNRSITKMIELIGQFNSSPSQDHDKSCFKIHVFKWKRNELTSVSQEFIHSCNNLLDGKINFEKFAGDLASVLELIINKSISYQDHSAVRDEFTKHLGGGGPGTALQLESVQNLMLEMENMYSIFQVEIEGLKKELDVNLVSQKRIASLQNEVEILKESKATTENQIENLKLINEDLDTQLSVTRAKLIEVQKRLSSVEVELDSKTHHYDDLEGTCLELQLQLESNSSNRNSEMSQSQEGLLQTGLEITKASAKLAECEETILKLGKQLKSLGSDKVVSITGTKKLKQRSSLRDQMLCEDAVVSNPESPKTKEIISTTKAHVPSVFPTTTCNPFSFPDGQVATPRPYLGMKGETGNAKAGALVIVPSKKRGGGVGLLRKLLLRRRKGSRTNFPIYFGK